jgi:AraC-like DNA-binding protein
VRPAASASDLLDAPVGRYVAGRAFAMWVPSAELVGASHFGAFDAADQPALEALVEMPFHRALATPCDFLHDLAAVDALDRRTFEMFARLVGPRMPLLAERARRVAVVRPAGLAGAAFTGLFHDWTAARFEARMFDDRAAALDWLGVSAEIRVEIADVLAPFEMAPVLRRIRDVLATDPAGATLASVAAAVGESTRSLQRHLADAGTSFRDELGRARIAAARDRLAETDDKIETIARELGFASLAAFTAMFARELGEPPQTFRKRFRG